MAGDAALELAGLLRELRTGYGSGATQQQVADALGLSVPLISSWERTADPKQPTEATLRKVAVLFSRTDADDVRLADEGELTPDETTARDGLLARLIALRTRARSSAPTVAHAPEPDFWRFTDGADILIVCAQLPGMQTYGADLALNRLALHNYADVDALVELFGYLRKVNPDSTVGFRRADRLNDDDMQSHIVLLGNLAWGPFADMKMLDDDVPLAPVGDTEVPDGEVFEVREGGTVSRMRPRLVNRTITDEHGDEVTAPVVVEDVGLFLRTRSKVTRERTVTICSGVYTRGAYAAVRILTDDLLRKTNGEILRDLADGAETFGLLMRVTVMGPRVATPDLRDGANRLFSFTLPLPEETP